MWRPWIIRVDHQASVDCGMTRRGCRVRCREYRRCTCFRLYVGRSGSGLECFLAREWDPCFEVPGFPLGSCGRSRNCIAASCPRFVQGPDFQGADSGCAKPGSGGRPKAVPRTWIAGRGCASEAVSLESPLAEFLGALEGSPPVPEVGKTSHRPYSPDGPTDQEAGTPFQISGSRPHRGSEVETR